MRGLGVLDLASSLLLPGSSNGLGVHEGTWINCTVQASTHFRPIQTVGE